MSPAGKATSVTWPGAPKCGYTVTGTGATIDAAFTGSKYAGYAATGEQIASRPARPAAPPTRSPSRTVSRSTTPPAVVFTDTDHLHRRRRTTTNLNPSRCATPPGAQKAPLHVAATAATSSSCSRSPREWRSWRPPAGGSRESWPSPSRPTQSIAPGTSGHASSPHREPRFDSDRVTIRSGELRSPTTARYGSRWVPIRAGRRFDPFPGPITIPASELPRHPAASQVPTSRSHPCRSLLHRLRGHPEAHQSGTVCG